MQTSFFGNTIDVSNAPERPAFVPLEPGWYVGMCTDFEAKTSEKGLGAKVTFTISEGKYSGRKVFSYLVITHNTSQQAHDIGQRRLKDWCDALGVPTTLSDAAPLMNKNLMIKLRVDPAREFNGRTYEPSNSIESFKPWDGMPVGEGNSQPAQVVRPAPAASTAAVAQTTSAAPAATTAAAAPAKKMPWQK